MKSKEAEVMDTGDDHDQMLRAMFESCDTVGLGLLTPKDFERLCIKLSIQEHAALLSEVLFSETNKRRLLCYETFRDTLILFLTGDSSFANVTPSCEKEAIYTTGQSETEEDKYKSEDKTDSESEWNNNFNQTGYNNENEEFGRFDSNCYRISGSGDEILTSEPNFVDESNRRDDICQNNKTESNCRSSPDNRRRPSSTGSPGKYKRYGRRSKPDQDLLQNRKNGDSERPVVLREVQMENMRNLGAKDEGSPENSPWKGVEVSFVSGEPTTPIAMQEEHFTGEGDDDEWKRPDSEWMHESTDHDKTPTNDVICDDTVDAARSALDAVWWRVVGDPQSEPMNENQLGFLCSELGMGSQLTNEEDISQLFSALDQDNDGFVTFEEFSRQMSAFLGCSESDPNSIQDNERSAQYDLDHSRSDVFVDNKESVFSTSNLVEDDVNSVTSLKDDVTSTRTLSTSFQVVPSPQTNSTFKSSAVTPTKSDMGSNPTSPALSEESRTPDSRSGLSLESDTSPLCPAVVPVEPRQLAAIHRGRRRRRTVAAANPASMRHQRRKSSRAVPLPHYHPISLRKLDELPLSYLTEENERYVSLDSLRQCWEREGLENSSEVFETLQVSTSDQTVSVEALSEVLDMEMDQNIVQKAALILYKNGINHYRGLYEHERAERSKLENNISHLMSQLHEQEERMEKVESKLETKAEDIESKYKVEIRNLTDELSVAQEKIKEFESLREKNDEYDQLVENYEKSRKLAAEMKDENERLIKEKEEVETRLLEAEEAAVRMREDLDAACRGLAMFSREHVAQKKQLADVLRMYEAHAQSVQDHHDELLDRLQYSNKRWTPNRSRSPNSRTRSSAGSYKTSSPLLRNSDTSSYSSASSMTSEENNSHHLSSVQLFLNDPATPSHFMTSSPSESLQRRCNGPEPTNLMTANAFAFLTPSTTQPKSRVNHVTPDSDLNTSVLLMPPPALSSDC